MKSIEEPASAAERAGMIIRDFDVTVPVAVAGTATSKFSKRANGRGRSWMCRADGSGSDGDVLHLGPQSYPDLSQGNLSERRRSLGEIGKSWG